ncbi:MAG: excinuclease ABC subunit UvrC [Bacteroidales bacterium]|nr:excinuclease ABC subunit UvrC [Bacteroidales bacterium]NLK81117.1 excinuclease ABC subunit UvrC [Bacteroidales bacterium]HPY82518.1 excinuclease ABC subunit UvrC [Bacteroidales bacterium]
MQNKSNSHILALKDIVAVLPEKPGIYQFYDTKNTLLYVGKAKNLKKRVASYFNKEHEHAKTRVLVKKINSIQHIVVSSEQDALLLENNMIKKYRPRYNVMLKDDKTYPWIIIKNEPFPRVFHTRTMKKDGSTYFGPYANVRMSRILLDMIRQLYKIRNCSLNLAPKEIAKGKYKVCLEYHIKNCEGPCVGLQTEDSYAQTIRDISTILKGNTIEILKVLRSKLQNCVDLLQFEEAAHIQNKIALLEKYQSKSTVVNPALTDIDVYSILDDVDTAFVNFLKVINGAVIQVHTIEIKKQLHESPEELLGIAITEIRQKIPSTAREIIVPFKPDFTLNDINFFTPQRGEKKQLLELSERNAKYFKLEQLKNLKRVDPERHAKRILETLKYDLQLPMMPNHIECFDNSNIQGAFPVAACVVFKQAKPSKQDYRHFNIKTVTGPNDFASMEEVIRRRYTRLIAENQELPQLVIVDGGKGQLSSAVKIFKELNIYHTVQLIGIAERLEEIYVPNDSVPIYLDKTSESLKLIQRMRDEAHRFGITHHRNQRSKHFIQSELTTIPGIGIKTAELLLSTFKSIQNIKHAQFQEIADVIGNSKAGIITHYFANKTE